MSEPGLAKARHTYGIHRGRCLKPLYTPTPTAAVVLASTEPTALDGSTLADMERL
jgi:hypothetical protein